MLYIIATPIGNLKDITLRALETLKLCDYCLCEDTRESQKLLTAYEITTPLVSYHKFNERSRLDQVLNDLREGKHIALISDAGTPLISDPGSILIENLLKHRLPFTHLPGPSASIFTYLVSGLYGQGFSFLGFLPKKTKALKDAIMGTLRSPVTTIYYLSPRQVSETLEITHNLFPDRQLFLGKEFTKKFESFFHGTAQEILQSLKNTQIKGEWAIAIAPASEEPTGENIDPLSHANELEKIYKLSRKEAIKLSAEILGLPKRELYQREHKNS